MSSVYGVQKQQCEITGSAVRTFAPLSASHATALTAPTCGTARQHAAGTLRLLLGAYVIDCGVPLELLDDR